MHCSNVVKPVYTPVSPSTVVNRAPRIVLGLGAISNSDKAEARPFSVASVELFHARAHDVMDCWNNPGSWNVLLWHRQTAGSGNSVRLRE
jgi:hypothetical protein